MALTIRKAEYFYTTVADQPGEAYKLLTTMADIGVNLLAFTAIPMGPERTQFTLIPEDENKLSEAARVAGFKLDGPHPAILVQGDDELGALTEIHEKLYHANVNVYASNGVADGKCCFGYILYIKPEEINTALSTLGI